MNAQQNDRDAIRKHSKSFALAAMLLPKEARERAEALYHYCRLADDLIDDAKCPYDAQVAVATLQQEAALVYRQKEVATPTALALERAVALCEIPKCYVDDLHAGFAMDAQGAFYDTQDELLLYCYRVAGVVGLMMCHALQIEDDEALPHAAYLGIGMQLTNIARDVAEDWGRGRVYLPREWGGPFVNDSGQFIEDRCRPAVRRCLALADQYYRAGEQGLRYLNPSVRVGIAAASCIYREIGHEIALRGYSINHGRAYVRRSKKWKLAAGCFVRSLPSLLWLRISVRPPQSVWQFRPLPALQPQENTIMTETNTNPDRGWYNAASNVCFALALTAIMGAALFVTVALNPKAEDYGNLPWYYSAGCVLLAILFYTVSIRLDTKVKSVQ